MSSCTECNICAKFQRLLCLEEAVVDTVSYRVALGGEVIMDVPCGGTVTTSLTDSGDYHYQVIYQNVQPAVEDDM